MSDGLRSTAYSPVSIRSAGSGSRGRSPRNWGGSRRRPEHPTGFRRPRRRSSRRRLSARQHRESNRRSHRILPRRRRTTRTGPRRSRCFATATRSRRSRRVSRRSTALGREVDGGGGVAGDRAASGGVGDDRRHVPATLEDGPGIDDVLDPVVRDDGHRAAPEPVSGEEVVLSEPVAAVLPLQVGRRRHGEQECGRSVPGGAGAEEPVDPERDRDDDADDERVPERVPPSDPLGRAGKARVAERLDPRAPAGTPGPSSLSGRLPDFPVRHPVRGRSRRSRSRGSRSRAPASPDYQRSGAPALSPSESNRCTGETARARTEARRRRGRAGTRSSSRRRPPRRAPTTRGTARRRQSTIAVAVSADASGTKLESTGTDRTQNASNPMRRPSNDSAPTKASSPAREIANSSSSAGPTLPGPAPAPHCRFFPVPSRGSGLGSRSGLAVRPGRSDPTCGAGPRAGAGSPRRGDEADRPLGA